MRFGVFASLLLHLAIVGAAYISLPMAQRERYESERVIPLELIAEAELDLTTSVPAARPEEPAPVEEEIEEPDLPEQPVEEEPPAPVEEVEPEPAPVEVELEPKPEPEAPVPEPEPEPQPEPPRTAELDLDALSQLIDKERDNERAEQRVETPSETAEVAERARAAVGAGDRLTASDEAKMKAAVSRCWNAGAIIGAPNPETLIVSIDFELDRNGELVADPRVANAMQITMSGNRFWKVAEQMALRAVVSCAPYDFLPQDRYETWREFRVNFDPSEMVGL